MKNTEKKISLGKIEATCLHSGKSFFIYDSDGETYLPISLLGNPDENILCVGYDDEPWIEVEGKTYVSINWFRKQYAQASAFLEELQTEVDQRKKQAEAK